MRIFRLGQPDYKKSAGRISAARAPDQSSQSKFKNRRFYTASRTLLNM
jgi:hypothetical protein